MQTSGKLSTYEKMGYRVELLCKAVNVINTDS